MSTRLSFQNLRIRRRPDRGAVALMTALLAVVLVSIAALGVDLGNAMNRKQLTQNNSDYAALAGANGLPSTATPTLQPWPTTSTRTSPTPTAPPMRHQHRLRTAAMLTDNVWANGEVRFPWAPPGSRSRPRPCASSSASPA